MFHAFFTRDGGTSAPPFNSLNLSYTLGDSPQAVNANWDKVKKYLPFKEIHLLRQIHSDKFYLTEKFWGKSPLWLDDGDALITSLPGLGVGVLTADCVPVLMVNKKTKGVAAVHSGWRGTLEKISLKVLEKISPGAPENVKVVIGPAISVQRYRVGEEVVENFRKEGFPHGVYREDPSGNFYLDIPGAVRYTLLNAGVPEKNIEIVPCCTYECGHFFSYRRDKITGRQLSVIGIASKF